MSSALISWEGMFGMFFLFIFCFCILVRERISSIAFSFTKGFQATLLDISNKQHEIEIIQSELCRMRTSFREVSITYMGMFIQQVENSQRWAGWTERELSKMNYAVEKLAQSLSVDDKERRQIHRARARWNLIDAAISIFDSMAVIAYPKNNQEAVQKHQQLRDGLDKQWKEKDIVEPSFLREMLSDINCSNEQKSKISGDIDIYEKSLTETFL